VTPPRSSRAMFIAYPSRVEWHGKGVGAARAEVVRCQNAMQRSCVRRYAADLPWRLHLTGYFGVDTHAEHLPEPHLNL
jgi:hypothetical protein